MKLAVLMLTFFSSFTILAHQENIKCLIFPYWESSESQIRYTEEGDMADSLLLMGHVETQAGDLFFNVMNYHYGNQEEPRLAITFRFEGKEIYHANIFSEKGKWSTGFFINEKISAESPISYQCIIE